MTERRAQKQQAREALLRAELPKCPVSEYIPVGGDCTCESETCKKDQFCYSPDDGKDKCLDEQKTDPYLIDVHGFTKNLGSSSQRNGAIGGRKFTFTKKKDDSLLRILYTDTFRVLCHHNRYHGRWIDGCAARWEIKIDGKSCPSGGIYQDWYVHRFQDPHRTQSFGGVCKGVSEGKHTVEVFVYKTPWHQQWNIYYPYTGWHAGHGTPRATVHMEVQEIPESYPLFHYATGTQMDGRDSGMINARVISFKKLYDDSNLRLWYVDNHRVMQHHHGHGAGACRWEIRIDGQSCPSGKILGDLYIHRHENPHRPKSMVGYCTGLEAGDHKVEVHVSTTPGLHSSDCFTGWHSARWILEAEEIPKLYDMVHYNMQHQTDHREHGILNNYKVTFQKKYDETRLRLLFMENLRAYSRHIHANHAHGRTCSGDWEIFIDGKACASVHIHAQMYSRRLEAHGHWGNIGGSHSHNHGQWWWVWPAHFANQDTNNHRVRTFAGFCDDVSSGEHTLTVMVKSPFGKCDLWTGWHNLPGGNGGHGTLEAIEFFRPCSEFDSKSECQQPKCHWDEDECIDLAECPGSDKVAVGADCLCGDVKDQTAHDGAKPDPKSAARGWTTEVGLLLSAIVLML